jgi:hypothetical protein
MNKFEIYKNPDTDLFDEISKAIMLNNNYCCCAVDRTPDTMCMCADFRASEEGGFCHCGRFYKVETHEIVSLVYSLARDIPDESHIWYWRKMLEKSGFMTFEIELSMTGELKSAQVELNKSKIAKSDMVIVIDELISPEHRHYLSLLTDWAADLKKPVISTRELILKEEQSNDENNQSESI